MKRMSGWLMAGVLAGGALVGLVGCKPSEAVRQGHLIGKGTKEEPETLPSSVPVIDPATLGSVNGTIHFSGKPPERVKIDMSMDPVCSITGGDNYSEQFVVHDGKLANVYVYVKDGPPTAMNAPIERTDAVVMDQVGCRYTPHVVAVTRGAAVEFRTSDATMHNIHTMPTVVGNETVDISQGAKGAPVQKVFKESEVMIPVRCNNHPWMNAFINVAPTPFWAVSDANGHFEIKGLPAGTYTLAVVHEKMGEQTTKVTIAPKEAEKADFTYSMK
jgi:plastocyanin